MIPVISMMNQQLEGRRENKKHREMTEELGREAGSRKAQGEASPTINLAIQMRGSPPFPKERVGEGNRRVTR